MPLTIIRNFYSLLTFYSLISGQPKHLNMSFDRSKDLDANATPSTSLEKYEDEVFDNEVISFDRENENDDGLLEVLRIAVKTQNVSMVQELLKERLNLQTIKGGYILWDAIFEDNVEIASMLIRSGANLNVKKPNDIYESSLLFELGSSKEPKHHKLALLTMEYGGKANEFEMEYIMCRAIDSGSLKIVEAVLRQGTLVRYSIIHQIVRNPLVVELITLLIGGDYVATGTKYRRAVNAFYQLYILPGDEIRIMPAIKALLDLGLDINVVNTHGDVLINAIRCRRSKTVHILIEHGINVNKPSRDGILPLYSAASTDQPDIVELLIKSGARINDRSGNDLCPQALHYGQYALHAACRGQPKQKVLNILLSQGANVNVLDMYRRTPFSHARFSGFLTDAHRLMIKHFAILESMGIGIHKFDRKIIEKNLEMKELNDECMSELKLMRSISISRDTTFFSILVRNVQKLSFHMRSRRFRNQCNEYQLEKLFPYYVEDMKLKLKIAARQKEAMVEKEEPVCEVLDYVLPYPALENVILHLYVGDVNDN